MPALHRALVQDGWLESGQCNLDVGGGRFDAATNWMHRLGISNSVYDPYNRGKLHNDRVMNRSDYDTATVANVLNVIAEKDARLDVLRAAKTRAGVVFISVYEGDRSGVGRVTRDGWQEHRKIEDYLTEVREVFPGATIQRVAKTKVIFSQVEV